MTTYTTMASLTLLLVLTWTLPAASFTLYQQEETNYQMTPVSHPEYESARNNCVEYEEQRYANCINLGLERVPDYLLPDIQILDLRYNIIRSLFNSSFVRCLQLTRLHISNNDIQNIEAATFHPLKYLLYLDISENPLESLHPDILGSSQSLFSISLSYCKLTSFPQNTAYAQHLNQVHDLMLEGNSLTRINISCHSESQETIDTISLRFNKFKELTHQTFRLDCDVNELNLLFNPITHIDSNFFASLRVQSFFFASDSEAAWHEFISAVASSTIKHLLLQTSELNIVYPHFLSPLRDHHLISLVMYLFEINDNIDTIFTHLHFLLELRTLGNAFTLLEPKYFFGTNRLQIIDLRGNTINKINPSKSTWNLIHLREMNLCANELYEITSDTFRGLTNLSILDLAFNVYLTVFDSAAFSGLNSLQYLNVSRTNLLHCSFVVPSLISLTSVNMTGDFLAPGETFRDTRSLQSLDLTNSKVKFSNLWLKDVSLFEGLSNLTYLSLNNNPVITLVSGMFHNLSALEFLDLSKCQITTIQAATFHGLISLRTLKLESNYIQLLPANLFKDLKDLTTCNLMRNNLSYLESQTFTNTISLKTLFLAGNRFTYFNRSTFEPIFATATGIDISNNPIVCNCELTWLVKWLKGPIDVLNITICSAGSETLAPLRGKPLLTFNPNKLCGPNVLLVSLVPLAAVGLIASMFLLYHYRWYVRFKLNMRFKLCARFKFYVRLKIYLLKLAVVGYEEVLDAREHGDFEFDLNIMFLEDDAQWVVEYLKPILEERLPNFNRNAIGDNDLILGMHYLDAVYYVIEKSFKTVILLSRAAVKDSWFMIKFRIAFDQVNDARMENVVLVFLEDIPDAEMPFLVRLYLSERSTYLEWMEDERGHEYFWDELILTLQRDNARWNNLIPPE